MLIDVRVSIRVIVIVTVVQRCSIDFYYEWRDLGPLIRILDGSYEVSSFEFPL
jgi:hypothetical protein